MKHTLIAVDLAKNVFEIGISTQPGAIAKRYRFTRGKVLPFFATQSPATVVMEACGSAHDWARRLEEQGHRVVLLPPHVIRPYVQRNKTDRTDVKGMLEAFRNDEIRPVPIKSVEQQGLTALHRLRSTWLADRTARINAIRGILREFGLVIPVGARHAVPKLWEFLEDADSPIPDFLRPALAEAGKEVRALEERIQTVELQLEQLAAQSSLIQRLLTIPGIGLITATALAGFVGSVDRFTTGRRFSSYFGLTPRESSTGQRRRLGRISKKGDNYLRMLLTHGGRTVLLSAARMKQPDRLRAWALRVKQRRGHNRAAIAVANKLARIVWAVWHRECTYQPQPKSQQA